MTPGATTVTPDMQFTLLSGVANADRAFRTLSRTIGLRFDGSSATATEIRLEYEARRTQPKWVAAAKEELANVDREAAAEGLATPSEIAKNQILRIIDALSDIEIAAASVYPSEDEGVELAFHAAVKGGMVVISCEANGQAVCFSSILDKNRRARYSDANDLPDAFLRTELLRLKALS